MMGTAPVNATTTAVTTSGDLAHGPQTRPRIKICRHARTSGSRCIPG